LGRDASLKTTAAGKPMLQLALAYNYGANKDTQWLDVSAVGDRFEKLAQYFTKGTAIVAYLDNVHVRTYQKKDGTTGFSLSAMLRDFEFAGSKSSGGSSSEPASPAAVKEKLPGNVQDMADDELIPF
jgi:single-stranded DNA-binding protein